MVIVLTCVTLKAKIKLVYLNILVAPRSELKYSGCIPQRPYFVSIINKTDNVRVYMTLKRVRVNIIAVGKQ